MSKNIDLDKLATIDEQLSIAYESKPALLKQIKKVDYIDSKKLFKDLKRPAIIIEGDSYVIRFYFKNKIRLTMAIIDKKEVIADMLDLNVDEVTIEDEKLFNTRYTEEEIKDTLIRRWFESVDETSIVSKLREATSNLLLDRSEDSKWILKRILDKYGVKKRKKKK